MSEHTQEIADRIKSLREDNGIPIEEMAHALGRTPEAYASLESGEHDLTFAFIYKCAAKLGVDVVDLLTSESPRLTHYSIVRAGDGLPVDSPDGKKYLHKAPFFKNRIGEPFYIEVAYSEELEDQPIALSHHKGQEFDYVLKGRLRYAFENHIEEVSAGDTLYFDSGREYGMIAIDGEDAALISIVFRPKDEVIE